MKTNYKSNVCDLDKKCVVAGEKIGPFKSSTNISWVTVLTLIDCYRSVCNSRGIERFNCHFVGSAPSL